MVVILPCIVVTRTHCETNNRVKNKMFHKENFSVEECLQCEMLNGLISPSYTLSLFDRVSLSCETTLECFCIAGGNFILFFLNILVRLFIFLRLLLSSFF